VRRFAVGFLTFLTVTGSILVLPVYAAPLPQAHPVETSISEVALGSVVEPVGDAVVGIDGEVQPGGVEEAEAEGVPATEAPAETPAPEATVPEDEPTDDDVVVSGDELRGVPALTVSQPETEPFSSVGVTWQEDPSITDVVAQIRVKRAGGGWSGWTTLAADDVEQEESPQPGLVRRGGTAPYWTGPAQGVEVVVQGSRGEVPQDVRVALVDPGHSNADAVPSVAGVQDQANAAVSMPPIISRAAWGADESLMQWTPQYAPTIKAATVHHTADSNNYTADQVPAIMRSIYAYHSQTRGWGDIGYHMIVDKFGRIYEGRAGGLASTVIGAHAGGFNMSTFGVSMLGNYDVAAVPQATVNAVADAIAWKLSLYKVNPAGSTVLTSAGGGTSKYPAGQQVTLPTIFGHRDVGSTVCPGRYGYARMPEIRAGVAARTLNEPFVRSLYQDMMGRPADSGGLTTWTTALARGTDRRSVSRGFSNSYEYRLLSITHAYRQVLGREPDSSGITTWMNELATGRLSIDALGPTLMSSAEFYNRGGSSDAAFVDNIYRAALGRGAAASEVTFWAGIRQRYGPATVINGVWGSSEAAMRRVDQAYRYYLARPAARSEQEFWLPVIMGRGDEQLREEIVISSEYFGRGATRFP
jgi:uncharacterized protein with LGFP repeats